MKRMHKKPTDRKHSVLNAIKGFTIVELMIATLVFSVILLVIAFGVLHFSSEYYKGINSSTTQNVARGIMDTVSQGLQFSGGKLTGVPASGYVCVGGQRFQYSLGKELPVSPPLYGLYQVSDPTCGAGVPPGGRELLQDHMRLVNFSITQVGATNLYNVNIKVAYGDDDLLCSPSVLVGGINSCDSNATMPSVNFTNADLRCKLKTGSQFCAVSTLSTTVQQRVTGS